MTPAVAREEKLSVRGEESAAEVQHLVYVAKYPESVFWSQVFEVLRSLRAEGRVQGRVILLAGIEAGASSEVRNRLGEACRREGVELYTFEYAPIYPFLVRRMIRSLKRTLGAMQVSWDETVVHVRDEFNAWLLHRAGFRHAERVLVDVRASNVEEVELYSNAAALLKHLKLRYKRAALREVARYRHLNVVSERLKEYLEQTTRLDARRVRCSVVPSLAGPDFRFDPEMRASVRRELGLGEDEIAVIFSSGGVSGWQQIESIVRDLSDYRVKVINLSRVEVPGDNVINRFVDYSKVPGYLMAADLAVLWREDNIVNQVASPVKFAEYVCCGLPVVVNPAVHSARAFVEETGHGAVVDDLGALTHEAIRGIVAGGDRVRASQSARRVYGVEVGARVYLDQYAHMAGKTE